MSHADKPTEALKTDFSQKDFSQNDEHESDDMLAGKNVTFCNVVT